MNPTCTATRPAVAAPAPPRRTTLRPARDVTAPGARVAALYRTRITHLRRHPVQHYFERSSYSWFVDLDALPGVPRWLRPFARFEARDHLWDADVDTLRGRVDAFLESKGIDLPGGRITALMQPRVLGFAFNPLTLYWCHDANGVLRCVVAEVQNPHGERHAYLLPPSGDDHPAIVDKRFPTSTVDGVGGHYLVRAPEPAERLDIKISSHRGDTPAFVATVRGDVRPATSGQIVALQLLAPAAPLMDALSMRIQGVMLRLKGVPVGARPSRRSALRCAQ
ncbi:hypothetical protein MPNTM1_02340 [Mycolicibacterium parafortuitum]|uniref:DUF1365 domain-containing protein n=1 Tax=Mycolicibacterium parafortuitum TaxID=39692 RepID=UPI003A712CC9